MVSLYSAIKMMHGPINIRFTVVSPDDGHTVARKKVEKINKAVHQVGFIYKIIQGCTVNKT